MKIAVIGAGIFGITSALFLKDAGVDVEIFEKNDDILTGASFCNQLRLHRGYHYPRSPETVDQLLASIPLFEGLYKESVISTFENYYCISKENSLTSAKEYIDFCDSKSLDYESVDLSYINKDNISKSFLVEESLISYDSLKGLCHKKLEESGVKIHLKTLFEKRMEEQYDYVVNCAYSEINKISNNKKDYQFELCEKIIAKLPNSLNEISIVVMDGPFMCIDPYGHTGYHLLGNVVHAIHNENIGKKPIIPKGYEKYINRGFQDVGTLSKFDEFIKTGKDYIPCLENAEYIKSMFTFRTVLPNVEKTDERPTFVSKKGKVIDVFSGKIDTCARAAMQVVSTIRDDYE